MRDAKKTRKSGTPDWSVIIDYLSNISFNSINNRENSIIDQQPSNIWYMFTPERVDARSRFQINTAEWFNGVFLCIKLTHDFKNQIRPWTYG